MKLFELSIKDLKELNKEAEIDYDGYNIESLVSADKLVLPEGYEYDESLGINNKNSTENQNYISIKVNVKANNKGASELPICTAPCTICVMPWPEPPP